MFKAQNCIEFRLKLLIKLLVWTHLEHHQVDQVDHGDDEAHEEQALGLLDAQLAEAAEEDGDDPTEHVPRARPHVGTQLGEYRMQ